MATHAPLIVGGIGMERSNQDQGQEQNWNFYNSAFIIDADGERVGRYDKIHLVPFGEYIPFQNLLTFAHKLTGRVGLFTRGTERNAFLLDTQSGGSHRYGVFICYEAVFADEVRQFARHGAEVFVNISDDGWYGDTSAPWQHLNMARMRAIENRRWLLARHQLRRDRGDRSVRKSPPVDSPPPDRRAARGIRLSQRHHVLHGARGRVCVAMCSTQPWHGRLGRKRADARRVSLQVFEDKIDIQSTMSDVYYTS